MLLGITYSNVAGEGKSNTASSVPPGWLSQTTWYLALRGLCCDPYQR